MGVKLIFKNCDFSENALIKGLPSAFDYNIIGFCVSQFDIDQLPHGDDFYYFNPSSKKLIHYYGNEYVEVPFESGTLKMAEDLYCIYASADFSYRTLNEVEINPTLSQGYWVYDSANNSFSEVVDNPSYVHTLCEVKKGDIIIFKGVSGSSTRCLGVKNNSGSIEFIASPNIGYGVHSAYIVRNDGHLYYSTSDAKNAFIQVLRK